MKKENILIKNIGCMRRKLDAEYIKKYLLKNEYSVIKSGDKIFNTIIIFTCAFSNQMTDKSYEEISFWIAQNRNVILSGCLKDIEGNDFFIKNKIKYLSINNLQQIETYFPPQLISFSNITDGNSVIDNKYLIRTSKGCLGKCNYCAIKKAIGKLKSKSLETIKKEFEKALATNIYNFRLIADDGGAYGQDISLNISNLLTNLLTYEKIKLLDFEISPKWLIKYFSEIYNTLDANDINYEITIPIQSGSSKILKKMNRFSDVSLLIKFLIKLKEIKKLYLITHFIIGYPEEDYKDINNTLKLINKIMFSQINIFKFSNKLNFENNINDEEIENRFNFFIKELSKKYIILDKNQNPYYNYLVLRRK